MKNIKKVRNRNRREMHNSNKNMANFEKEKDNNWNRLFVNINKT